MCTRTNASSGSINGYIVSRPDIGMREKRTQANIIKKAAGIYAFVFWELTESEHRGASLQLMSPPAHS